MSYPAEYYSDEDDFEGFMSDDYEDYDSDENFPVGEIIIEEETLESKLDKMMYAISSRNTEEVFNLLNGGLNPNEKLKNTWTPLMLAASLGISSIVDELIKRGADVNWHIGKYTVLMETCSNCDSNISEADYVETVSLLISNGVKVDAVDKTKKTALMFASSAGNLAVVERLIPLSNVSAEDIQGWNALFWAVYNNRTIVVPILLNAGLSANKSDVRGFTISYYALSHNNEELLQVLGINTDNESTDIISSYYNFEEIFKNLHSSHTLILERDVQHLLYGMKCEKLFSNVSNLSLFNFLTLDIKQLEKLGILIPYQQKRILSGLLKFHKHPYKRKSIPFINKDVTYTTIDVMNAIFCSIRQIIAMQASIQFITTQFDGNNTNENNFKNNINVIKSYIEELKKVSSSLLILTRKWDNELPPTDIIIYESDKPYKYRKLMFGIGLTVLFSFAFNKLYAQFVY